MGDEARQVLFRTGRRERARHGEQHQPAAFEETMRVDGVDAVVDALDVDFGDCLLYTSRCV